ncbi:HNH endonuclease [Streptomyces sp. ISL-99]|uniref:HNH endonuclease family protein n=1 Tax=Streptomyces sp. ISL-99 TaxID=2819193 RepID=UPI001BE5FA2F|nr:HNH endonuclease family protein [Streptomyces sp. ISL-99]MBT2529932.1 HNH endonuclease [Streptomyces sp. ISL-99]
MIKSLLRAASVAALTILPLTTTMPAPAHAAESLPLSQGIERLAFAAESRDGYQRNSFKHWNAGKLDDGCNARAEVLIAEAIEAPTVGERCSLTGGVWHSYYDGQHVTAASALDVDHMVPLAEAWDSGAWQWTAVRREAYANDLDAERSLVAVTARSNRAKADKDPAQWLPPAAEVHCQYAADWVATKLRWGLTLDAPEHDALQLLVEGCADTTVTFELVP